MALTGTDAFGVVNLPVSLGGTSFKKDVLEKSEGERVWVFKILEGRAVGDLRALVFH